MPEPEREKGRTRKPSARSLTHVLSARRVLPSRVVRKRAFVLIVFLFVSGTAVADDKPPPRATNATNVLFDTVAALLRSSEPVQCAWGAHLAASLPLVRAHDVRSALVRLLDKHAYKEHWDDRSVAAAAWDALIRLRLVVNPDKLLTHLEHWSAQAIILLARDRDASRLQLRSALKKGLRGADWMAVIAALVDGRDPKVADALLWGLRLKLVVDVVPAENMAIGASGGDGSERPKLRVLHSAGGRNAWPPFVDYALTDAGAAGDELLVAGRQPIHFRRVPSVRHAAQRVRITPSAPQHRFRLRMLEGLMGRAPGAMWLKAEMHLRHPWTTEEAYVAAVQGRWRRIQGAHHSMLKALVLDRLLTGAEASRQRVRLRVKPEWFGTGERKFPVVEEPR